MCPNLLLILDMKKNILTCRHDDNSCIEGGILGGIAGGGIGAASRGDGRWWAIPLGIAAAAWSDARWTVVGQFPWGLLVAAWLDARWTVVEVSTI